MSALTDLSAARDRIEALAREPGVDPIELALAVKHALAPPPISGSPAGIRAQAHSYGQVELQLEAVSADIAAVADDSLPSVWQGRVAETAARAVQAVADEVRAGQSVMAMVSEIFASWAAELEQAQQNDHEGLTHLEAALAAISGYDMVSGRPESKALPLAQAGVAARVAAAQKVEAAVPSIVSRLNQSTGQARARQVTATDLDALDAVVLATETNAGAYGPSKDILSPTALALGSQRLDALPDQDRAAFEALLATCVSSEEAAYVWKALAAGHSVSQVESFAAAIRPHGDDPGWLAEHLAVGFDDPKVGFGTDPAAIGMSYQGRNWSAYDPDGYDLYDQGAVGDCVAASTVVGQAALDPTLMLTLTTGEGGQLVGGGSAAGGPAGGGPAVGGPAVGDDSPSAFQQRLQQIYLQEYAVGQRADGFLPNALAHETGITSHGEDVLANQELDGATGGAYAFRQLHSAADRQAVLPQIEAAVDAGKPVPLDVSGPPGGHQILIVGRQGDELEIYNPWGFTEQVAESRFVDGTLGALTAPQVGGPPWGIPTADGVELPA